MDQVIPWFEDDSPENRCKNTILALILLEQDKSGGQVKIEAAKRLAKFGDRDRSEYAELVVECLPIDYNDGRRKYYHDAGYLTAIDTANQFLSEQQITDEPEETSPWERKEDMLSRDSIQSILAVLTAPIEVSELAATAGLNEQDFSQDIKVMSYHNLVELFSENDKRWVRIIPDSCYLMPKFSS